MTDKRQNVVLSKRLQALVNMVTPGNRTVDVGCDHGFVSIYLVQNKISPRVIAMDVGTGPLERAKEHISEFDLDQYIETRLSDGLHSYRCGEADTMICAGMGGRLMEKILTESADKAHSFRELILQPQSELLHFRRFLRKEGYEILDENIILEEGKYYFFEKLSYTGVEKQDEEMLADAYGGILLQRKDPVLKQYLDWNLKNARKIEQEILSRGSGVALKRLEELRQEQAYLEKALSLVE